jgi:peptidoglycan/LPS O-acetylase OafA/YrhL
MSALFYIMEFFGKISYSCYLLHAIFGVELMTVVLKSGYNRWTAALLGVAISIALSLATYYIVERPAIDLGKKLVRWQNGKREFEAPA